MVDRLEFFLGDNSEMKSQRDKLIVNARGVLAVLNQMTETLQGKTEVEKKSFKYLVSDLENIVTPSPTSSVPTSYEATVRRVIDPLERILHYYPQYADIIFLGYEGVFNSSFDQEKYKSAFPESNIQSFARRTERLILYAQRLGKLGEPPPKDYDDLFVRAGQAGAKIYVGGFLSPRR